MSGSAWVMFVLAAAAGAMARFLVDGVVRDRTGDRFPYGTFVINVSGCLAIGFLAVLADERLVLGPAGRLFWMAGILGGYTTFSAFGYETAVLLRASRPLAVAVNVMGQVLLGLVAVLLGAALARLLR